VLRVGWLLSVVVWGGGWICSDSVGACWGGGGEKIADHCAWLVERLEWLAGFYCNIVTVRRLGYLSSVSWGIMNR